MKIEKAPDGAIAWIPTPGNDRVTIWIIPKEGESPDDAIKRVAAHHNVDPGTATRANERTFKSLNPVDGIVERLRDAAEEGDAASALLHARSIVEHLEKEQNITRKSDDEKEYDQAVARAGALRPFFDSPDPGKPSIPSTDVPSYAHLLKI